jgi:hypothetical protein
VPSTLARAQPLFDAGASLHLSVGHGH